MDMNAVIKMLKKQLAWFEGQVEDYRSDESPLTASESQGMVDYYEEKVSEYAQAVATLEAAQFIIQTVVKPNESEEAEAPDFLKEYLAKKAIDVKPMLRMFF